jgi:hypothetical protein
MAQKKPRNTVVLGLRVPIATAEAIYAAAGGKERFTEWASRAFQQHLTGLPLGIAAGFEEGKRQGWAHANKVFREALGVAAERLKGKTG